MKTKLSYAIGTTVIYTHFNGKRKKGIISEVSVSQCCLDYAIVDAGAWFDHEDMEFVSDPTPETMDIVYKELETLEDEGDE